MTTAPQMATAVRLGLLLTAALVVGSCARLSGVKSGGAADGGPQELTCGTGQKLGNAGCNYYVAQPSLALTAEGIPFCFALMVVNPGTSPAMLQLERGTTVFQMDKVARMPQGAGTTLTYQPFDSATGLTPGGVAIVFLAGPSDAAPRDIRQPPPDAEDFRMLCPFGTTAAVVDGTGLGIGVSGVGQAFHLTSDRPVVAYDINPYGGAYSHVTSASLLLPVDTWTGNYVTPAPPDNEIDPAGFGIMKPNTLLVIASQDGTEVSLRGRSALEGGPGVPETPAGQTAKLRLDAGQFAQVQAQPGTDPKYPSLMGTVVSSTRPVAVVIANPCIFVPATAGWCDGIHQQIPPLSAWGSEYAAVRHRSRIRAVDEELGPWQILAAVDGTELAYSPHPPRTGVTFSPPPPTRMAAGESAYLWTDEPFVVRSQDAAHPIYVSQLMTGCRFPEYQKTAPEEVNAGDPEFVNVVPTDQYLTRYTLFTDPTYPDTSLTLVRKPGADGAFADVKLDCAPSAVTDWKSVGTLQYARVDLVRGDYQPQIPGCNNGVHVITSSAPFGVTVWGWASTAGGEYAGAVSYAYPGGANLTHINDVIIP